MGGARAHLYGLSVVHLHHVKAEAVDASPRRREQARLQIEVISDVHEDLQPQRRSLVRKYGHQA